MKNTNKKILYDDKFRIYIIFGDYKKAKNRCLITVRRNIFEKYCKK